MWNAYHIISNRARSVCYATRQSQFRRQTETAVNQLSHSTIQQLKAMEELSNTQEEARVINNFINYNFVYFRFVNLLMSLSAVYKKNRKI